MEMESAASAADYPVLFIPKNCTTLEINCEKADDVFFKVNITSPDTDGNDTNIYSGFCNVKLIDTHEMNINLNEQNRSPTYEYVPCDNNYEHVAEKEYDGSCYVPDNQGEVWIDPARSPYIYNSCNIDESKERDLVYHSPHITVQQHNTYITQNVYNFQEGKPRPSSPTDEFEHKKFRKYQSEHNFHDDDEVECGVILSKLPEEIWNEKQKRDRKEMQYVGLDSDNDALKQLMSSDIQSWSKQQKTILFLGRNAHYGPTLQKIAINDPNMKCSTLEKPKEITNGTADTDEQILNQKKYQCDKCKQIFSHIGEFKLHMVDKHKSIRYPQIAGPAQLKFTCLQCGKNMKSQHKFEMHCLGHGDPERQCDMCHKVFASKFTLRIHKKTHLKSHIQKHKALTLSNEVLETMEVEQGKTELLVSIVEELNNSRMLMSSQDNVEMAIVSDVIESDAVELDAMEPDLVTSVVIASDAIEPDVIGTEVIKSGATEPDVIGTEVKEQHVIGSDVINLDAMEPYKQQEVLRVDSIIDKVMANDMFLRRCKGKNNRKYRKPCEVCQKVFTRVGDLKRHLIEHIVKHTLSQSPINEHGTLTIVCSICKMEVFSKVDKYKAHLREHAKLTLYKCTVCDKSFSDSSNFSKHKKIHGSTYFQCDLCHRKFNSKKMIAQHLEYHNKFSPVKCYYCKKEFHFKSMLNKHIKNVHTKAARSQFRCRFCPLYFRSLKEKWDHEWEVHSVRNMIVDCGICGEKFRKYSVLKRHCNNEHNIRIPLAKTLLC